MASLISKCGLCLDWTYHTHGTYPITAAAFDLDGTFQICTLAIDLDGTYAILTAAFDWDTHNAFYQ